MISSRSRDLFREQVEGSRRIVLTTHVNPDGDAIGSQLGLARLLRARGKEVRILNQDNTPTALRFLEGDGIFVEVHDPAEHDAVLSEADIIVLLDNSAPDRLGRLEERLRASAERVLCIDHHPTRVTPWVHNILDEEACATATMIYDLALACGWAIDRRVAEALYVGLATDTGFFRFNSATPRAYEIAAELMRAGADPARCYRHVYERNSAAYTRLLGHALSQVRLDARGAVASIRVTRDLVARCEAEGEDTSEMTTALLAIDGVRIAILFRETEEGKVKVSLRSKGNLDVRLLAAEFGGGGHRNASGIVLAGSLDEITERVVDRSAELATRSL